MEMLDKKFTFRSYFITGLISILPLWLTLFILWFIFKWVSDFTSPFLRPIFDLAFGGAQIGFLLRVSSFILTISIIWFIGFLATHIFGKRLLAAGESVLLKLPIMRELYLSVRKFTQYLFTKKTAFRQVVLIEFPIQGAYSIGFITTEAYSELKEKVDSTAINVFVSTTPNPTTGFLVIVPKDKVIPLKMTINEAFRFMISGGIITPETVAMNADPDANLAGVNGQNPAQ